MKIICDKCGEEISEDEANECDIKGDWIGAMLCNDCYAELDLKNRNIIPRQKNHFNCKCNLEWIEIE